MMCGDDDDDDDDDDATLIDHARTNSLPAGPFWYSGARLAGLSTPQRLVTLMPPAVTPVSKVAASAVAVFAPPAVSQLSEPTSAPPATRPSPRRTRSEGPEVRQDHDCRRANDRALATSVLFDSRALGS